MEDWKRVVWSDETKINHFGSDGKELGVEEGWGGSLSEDCEWDCEVWGGLSDGMGMYDVEWSWICMQD